jgi:hypothetical protein
MNDGLPIWTIYVVRRCVAGNGVIEHDRVAQYAPDLATARALIPRGLVMLARNPADDPVIVETWL